MCTSKPPPDSLWYHLITWTVWPSGLRRWPQAPVRKGVGSNPTAVTQLHATGEPGPYGCFSCRWSSCSRGWICESFFCFTFGVTFLHQFAFRTLLVALIALCQDSTLFAILPGPLMMAFSQFPRSRTHPDLDRIIFMRAALSTQTQARMRRRTHAETPLQTQGGDVCMHGWMYVRTYVGGNSGRNVVKWRKVAISSISSVSSINSTN